MEKLQISVEHSICKGCLLHKESRCNSEKICLTVNEGLMNFIENMSKNGVAVGLAIFNCEDYIEC